ncbi:putative phosphoribosylformylglycinamidine synthase, chloroplastic/mitochondrial [Symbiodinium microadriaticum]|uniref:Putative phosphoribosylformylglycinamidine synthase, chloroplastic/mitochondrial n=1 Tax=Symbiodinium microadriaticum TaxID=2951 RepID=A0A1Q9DWZ8_SYMMI|nr:putative phosphoribosylformylglycinamidine synthase, chloroplastic/mitochondrial [Symbiodinium microadriaticum]
MRLPENAAVEVVAAVAGYAVGNLHIPGYDMPWEHKDFKYPSNMAPPLQVLIDCSNGASDYGNKFGEPLICGWTRSCGVRMPESGERFEWVKPIMLSGGVFGNSISIRIETFKSPVVAAVAGYAVGNLHIPGYDMPWEHKDFKYPSNMAPPLQVLIDCSNGASDYGNKFGEPLICGWTRSCGVRMPESGERFEWVKPIMLSGGRGARVDSFQRAASSMVAGDNQAELDFNAVQRGDAEMQQKVNRVVRACVELGTKNPILSIHDQGAGGSGNVLKEISEPAGAVIDLRKMHVGDPSMSILELWTAEFQENNALLLPADKAELFDKICKREKVSYAIMGTITGDGKVVVKDSRDGSTPVDLPLDKVLGKMPQKVFPMQRLYKKPPRSLDLPASLTVQVALETGVLRLLSVCSKRFLTNKVDRSVTGQIAQQQCVGPLQTPLADFACIAQSPLATSGGATAIGEQPLKGLAGNAASTVRTVEESTEVLLRKSGTSEKKAQQICVAVRMDDNPGSTEKDTVNGRVPVCNAIVQQGGTRVRCTRHNAFERRSPLATSGGATAIGEQPLKGLALTNLVWIRIPTLDAIKASGNWMWAAKLPGEGPKMYDIAEALSHMMVELGIAIDGGKDSLSMASRVPLGNGQVETAKSPGQFVLTVYYKRRTADGDLVYEAEEGVAIPDHPSKGEKGAPGGWQVALEKRMDTLSNRVQAFLSKMEEEYFFGEGVGVSSDSETASGEQDPDYAEFIDGIAEADQAPVPDVRIKATPDLKTKGDGVLLFVDLGQGPPVLGGSALSQEEEVEDDGAVVTMRYLLSERLQSFHCFVVVGGASGSGSKLKASEIERVALDLDRAGDPEQAVAVYRQVAERLAKAAASCPEGNPDRAVLARHAGEVLGRVVYLESLNGAPAAVPPEGHIGCDHLVIPGPGVERQVSDGFQLISSPRRESGALCPAEGGVVGFLSCGECFDVIQEWRGREGTLFLKLAGDKGWVFDKTRTGTFCVPVGSEWQDWRGPEGHKAWTANNRDQHGSWNNAPGGNGRDRGGDKWKWAWDDNDRGWGSSKQSSSSWKGQEDKWAWHEQDRDAWSGKEWKSWGYNGQNKTESHKNSW